VAKVDVFKIEQVAFRAKMLSEADTLEKKLQSKDFEKKNGPSSRQVGNVEDRVLRL